ncbi:MAG: ATP-dependent DNA helicase [Acidobacteria bacterium]|nr:MAG: ATP-dependent DNA helicase [Acidobacteriota bacterium]
MNLSDQQAQAIEHRGTHLRIVACAGSGKTEVMARRVAGLIGEGAAPASIVAFTFTERAAASLRNRIHKRIAEVHGVPFLDRLGPLFIGTIHAYCLRMLRDHVPHYGNYDTLDENRLAGLLSREYRRLGLDRLGDQHWAPIFDFLRNVEVVENELIDPNEFRSTDFGQCYEAYLETLRRYHFFSFGQLITEAIRALKDSQIYERVHGPLQHLLVDEYQDVNPAQEELIALLARPPVHLCVVGDDDQSIYQWRGSDVNNIRTFEARYRPSNDKTLSINRRSRPTILARANHFAKTISNRLPKTMEPHRQAGNSEVNCWAGSTEYEEAETIACTIERLVGRGYRYRDISILYRSVRTSSEPLIQTLRNHMIPFRCAGRTGLFRQPEAATLGKTYAWLVGNPWRSIAYGEPDSLDIASLVREYENVFNGGETITELQERLSSWKRQVEDESLQANLIRDYYRLLRVLRAHNLDLDDPNQAARMGCLARFSEILADFEHVTRRARYVQENGERVFRAGQDRGIWFYRKLFSYLQYYSLDAYEDFEGEDTFDLDAIDILTVHQAKGLEWPVVFIPCLTDKRFPSGKAGRTQEWLLPESVFPPAARSRYEGGDNEERRLFYVAMTRAKDSLYLSWFTKKKRAFYPSPYLVYVAGGTPHFQGPLPLPDQFTPNQDEAEEPPTLTFSELALYERCPLRYRLSSSFGFQPQIVTELGYGKAIHHLLRRLVDLTRQSKKLPTTSQVEQLFETEFYLPFANRPAFEQLFARASELVGQYLDGYSHDLLRVWETERDFELHLDYGVVQGRADVILDYEGGQAGNLAIVDYKTADDVHQDDVYAFQLAIYAAAARGEGLNIRAAYLHELSTGTRKPVPVTPTITKNIAMSASSLVADVVQRKFPAKPEPGICPKCDVRAVCKHAICGKHEF